MPAGTDVTPPPPVPASATASVARGKKVTPTDIALSIATAQVNEEPLHAPDQPMNAVVGSGVAVSCTTALGSKAALQLEEHSRPCGADTTRPRPLNVTLNTGFNVKVAVTDFAASSVTVQTLRLPAQTPVQPAKYDVGVAEAVRSIIEFGR
jgi:hypothetical protein